MIIDPVDPTYLTPPDLYKSYPNPYARGWNEIALQLQIRLSALPLLGPVHRFIKWVKESPESEDWQDYFMGQRADGRSVVNTWIINGATSPNSRISGEDSSRWIRRTSVELHGVLEIEDPISWYLWHSILSQIDSDLRNGDRTFNMSCLTHSLPEQTESVVTSFCGVDCHSAMIRFQVEEVGVYDQ